MTRREKLFWLGQHYERLAEKLALGDLVVPFDPCSEWHGVLSTFTYREVALLFYFGAVGALD